MPDCGPARAKQPGAPGLEWDDTVQNAGTIPGLSAAVRTQTNQCQPAVAAVAARGREPDLIQPREHSTLRWPPLFTFSSSAWSTSPAASGPPLTSGDVSSQPSLYGHRRVGSEWRRDCVEQSP